MIVTMADQIREIDFDIPAPEVAEILGCRKEYVRAVRARTRRPDHYNRLNQAAKKRAYARNPEPFLSSNRAWYHRNRETQRAKQRERMRLRRAKDES